MQHLKDTDISSRLSFAQCLTDVIWFSDEAHFTQPLRFIFMDLFKEPCLFTTPTKHECSENVYMKKN